MTQLHVLLQTMREVKYQNVKKDLYLPFSIPINLR